MEKSVVAYIMSIKWTAPILMGRLNTGKLLVYVHFKPTTESLNYCI